MKRKAQSQLQAPAKDSPKALAKVPTKATIPAIVNTKTQPKQTKPVQNKLQQKRKKEEESSDSDVSSDDGIDYMEAGSEDDGVAPQVVDFYDDGELSLNLPQKQKKSALFESDYEEEGEGEGEKSGEGTTKFSDDNNSWIKPKNLEGEDGDSDEDFDDDDKKLLALQDKLQKKEEKRKIIEAEAAQDLKEDIENNKLVALRKKVVKDGAKKKESEVTAMEEDQKREGKEGEEEEEEGGEDIQDIADRMENLHSKIQETVGILTEFKERRPEGVSREEMIAELKADIMSYFGYTSFLVDLYFNLFPPAEVLSHIEANETPRPLTIRVNTLKAVRRDLAQTLINKGVTLEPVKWCKVGVVIYESKVPIGATPEYLSGQYMLQSAASFLPVIALDPQANEQVLDMCAAPGGKTTFIAAMMKNTGTIHANDKNPDRIPALSANIHRMGVRNCVVSQLDGVVIPQLPLKFDRVLLDAPCMGLGVIAKDRSIKSSKEERDLTNCIDIQIKLLLAAIDSVDISKAAVIVYSTCSISVEENEAIVNKALKKRFVKVVDAGLPFGKEGLTTHRGKTFHPSLKLARRYYPHAHNIDGFFVCKLHKFANGIRNSQDKQAAEDKEIALLEYRAPLVLKKNVAKLDEGKLLFEPEEHRIDVAKEEQRTKKSKDKKARKKASRLARMRANAAENADGADDAEMEDAPPQPTKSTKPAAAAAKPEISDENPKKGATTPVAPAKTTTPAGKANGAAPQKRLRGSKQ